MTKSLVDISHLGFLVIAVQDLIQRLETKVEAKAKLGFIVSVSKSVEMSFQLDKPMVPFLPKQLKEPTRDILNLFIEFDVWELHVQMLRDID